MHLNYDLDENSIGHKRNFVALVWMLWGTMFEAVKILTELAMTNVPDALTGRDEAHSWLALDEMRQRWSRDPIAKKARDKLAFHFGDAPTVTEGLNAACTRGEPLEIF